MSPSSPHGRGWLRYLLIFCSKTYILPNIIPMEEFSIILLSELYLLQNIKRKIERIQKVLVTKSRNVRKTIKVFTHANLGRVSKRLRFTIFT